MAHAVRLAISRFLSWFGDNTKGLPFFPEYTDHGPNHISLTLFKAEALISDASWESLTPEDVATLALSVTLHDSAMHISPDSFLDLVRTNNNSRQQITKIDSKPWPQLFDIYFSEARRWNSRTLHNIIGDQSAPPNEEDLTPYIRHIRDNPNPEDWNPRYRKFIGEFIRRHHARLAHEIAVFGIPGTSINFLKETGIPAGLRDIAGLVARSHNMDVRKAILYLKEMYHGQATCQNSHPAFLMILLRIADYLQITPDRINPKLMQIQRLRSPISQEEWNAHLAVHEVRQDEQDKEAIFIFAIPLSARSFLKLRKLIDGLQRELDTSWAILGEVFSLLGKLSRLGITVRRVRSNLDDINKFIKAQNPDYLPIQASFETAGSDLIKLLVKPLYGDHPGIAVRELLQNALDAVRELRHCSTTENPSSAPLNSIDVSISIEQNGPDDWWLTVCDQGIGMDAEVITNYFLRAGASFRNSDRWQRLFETEGRSKILKSGRFGVGVLAAFLLGDRIEVSTRHINATTEQGLYFAASISDEAIELQRLIRQNCGTTVRVKLHHSSIARLKEGRTWDWYTLDDPRVERVLCGDVLDQFYREPSANQVPDNWGHIETEEFPSISWTFSEAPGVACNGLVIGRQPQDPYKLELKFFESQSPFATPALSISDPDGRLPLSLQRDSLDTRLLSFEHELLQDVSKDFLAFLLVHSPTQPPSYAARIVRPLRKAAFSILGDVQVDYLWSTKTGTALLHPWHLQKAGVKNLIILLQEGLGFPDFETAIAQPNLAQYDAVVRGNLNSGDLERIVTNSLRWSYSDSDLKPIGVRVLVPLREDLFRFKSKDASTKHLGAGWKILEYGDPGKRNCLIPLHSELVRQKTDSHTIAIEMVLGINSLNVRESAFTQIFDKFCPGITIPFDLKERKNIYADTFDALQGHISLWKNYNLSDWRLQLRDSRIRFDDQTGRNIARDRFKNTDDTDE